MVAPGTSLVSSGASLANPFRGEHLLVRLAPFAAGAAFAEASLALPPGIYSTPAAYASGGLLVATVAAFLLPWERLPRQPAVVVPLLYSACVLFLSIATGPASGVGIVLLVPVLWTALFHDKWQTTCAVAGVVAVELTVSLVQHASGAQVGRRIVLWALIGAIVAVAAHALRDRVHATHRQAARLQEQLREAQISDERSRIAEGLRHEVVNRLFASTLTLHGVGQLAAGAETHQRIDAIVADLDEAIRMLRRTVFDLEPPGEDASRLRREVLRLCDDLSPAPDLELDGEVEARLASKQQEQTMLQVLSETFTLLGSDMRPSLVQLSGEDGIRLRIRASRPADRSEASGDGSARSGLHELSARSGATLRLEEDGPVFTISWEFAPPVARPRAGADPRPDDG
ncbi:MAG TPA: histidine kinase [Acidimicrobiales bacterium]|nr:histidine kinase [Acidimicrobiales bacterium]